MNSLKMVNRHVKLQSVVGFSPGTNSLHGNLLRRPDNWRKEVSQATSGQCSAGIGRSSLDI